MLVNIFCVILCIIILCYSFYNIKNYKTIVTQKYKQDIKKLEKINQMLSNDNMALIKQGQKLKQDKEQTHDLLIVEKEAYANIKQLREEQEQIYKNKIKDVDKLHQEISEIYQRKNKVETELATQIKDKKESLTKIYKQLEDAILLNYDKYEATLDEAYSRKEKEINQQIDDLQRQKARTEEDLFQIKSTYQAAAAARLREQEDSNNKKFYSIQLTSDQKDDIQHLWGLRKNFNEPTILSKLIWSSYIIKPASDLCNRVLKTSKAITGIYKITNICTGDSYIGQSVDVATRWKTHIKSGLGIDASSTNKLYQAMQEYCIWNFTFQLLQECKRDKLNEKERYWIDFYQSNKVGYNVTKGNK